MKKIYLMFLAGIVLAGLTGCATTKAVTKAGIKIGTTYQKSAALGTVSAEESIKAWPYIHGQIKGLLAGNYDLEMPANAKGILEKLDAIAKKEVLTDEDKGFVIGSFCRLEAIAVREAWDRYGVSVTGFFKSLAGG